MLRTAITLVLSISPFLLAAACGGTDATGSTGTTGSGGGDTTGGGDTGGGGSPAEPTAGIPGCADVFIEEDGVCRPTLDKCPAGQIPNFAEGCKPVGIVGCAAAFLGEDGVCRPSMKACAEGTYAVPTKGCVPIDGDGCGEGTWGAIPDDASNVYVDAAYAGDDSDGSKAKPFKTLAAALAAADKGDRVAIAAGTYAEPLVIDKGIEVVGRCPSMVKITGTIPFFDKQAIVAIKNVGDPITVRRVQVGGPGVGLRVSNAEVTFDEVWVNKATSTAVGVSSASNVVMKRSLVEGTLAEDGGLYGDGVEVVQGAIFTAEDSAFVDNHLWNLSAFHGGSTLIVKNSLSEAPTAQESDGYKGSGITLGGGAEATIENTAVVAGQMAGLSLNDKSTLAVVSTSVFVDTSDTKWGIGIAVNPNAELELKASVVAHNVGSGLSMFKGSTVFAEGNLIGWSGGAPSNQADGYFVDGGHLVSKNDVVIGNEGIGVLAIHAGGLAEVTSGLIAANRERGDDTLGQGAAALLDGKLVLDKAAILDNRMAGVAVNEGEAEITSSLIEKTGIEAGSSSNGVGVFGLDAKVTVKGTLLRDNTGAGIALFNSTGTLANDVIRGVASGRVNMLTSSKGEGVDGIGDGLLALGGSIVTLDDSLVTQCARAGILFHASEGTIQRTTSTSNQYGVVAQGTDALALGEGNAFSGNTEKDEVTDGALPVP